MVVLELGAVHEVPQNQGNFRNLDLDRTFDCPHRGQSMGVCSNAAGTLDEMMGIPGVPALKDHFDAAEHLPGAPGIDHLTARDLHLDAKMTFDSGNRIDRDSFSHIFSSLCHDEDMVPDVKRPTDT
jgi:hypothetical protein